MHGDDSYLVRSLEEHAYLDAVMDGVTGRRRGEASGAVREALATASLTAPGMAVRSTLLPGRGRVLGEC